MSSLPYLNIGAGKFDWYQQNPAPLYFSLPAAQLLLNSFVGFENAGNYRINSLSLPPRVDFESPFAYYNFIPNSRYAQLVVRSESFPANDIFGGEAASHKTATSFRYSWAGADGRTWDYSLQVAGSVPLNQRIRLGNTKFRSVRATTLPSWVMSQSWPMVSFVQAMNGYPGSEGIYEYTPQIPPAWPWLLGSATRPPSYWQNPYLSEHTGTAKQKNAHPGETLAKGFRGEYNASDFRKPELYISPIDGLVHLAWATSGVWNVGQGWYVRTQSLVHGPYFDEWQLKHLTHPGKHPRARGGTTVQSVLDLGKYVLYSGTRQVVIRHITAVPSPKILSAPTNSTSWRTFLALTASAAKGRPPGDMASWLNSLAGQSVDLRAASIRNVFYRHGIYYLTLTVRHRVHVFAKIGLPATLKAGTYALIYNSSAQSFQVQTALVGGVASRFSIQKPLLAQIDRARVTLVSHSNVLQRVRAVFAVAGNRSRVLSVLVPPGGRVTHSWSWVPKRLGAVSVSLKVNGKRIAVRRLAVTDPSRSLFLKDSLPGDLVTVAAGAVLLLLILISTGIWLSATGTDGKHEARSARRVGDQ
jgi:hypothetical protein